MITVGLNHEGKHSTSLANVDYADFTAFSATFAEPAIGVKDGSYFVRTGGTVRSNEGLYDNSNVLIIDADSSIDLGTGEVIPSAPKANLVHDALVNASINHAIYSSFSNSDTVNKYRVLIECEYSREQLSQTCLDVISLLHDNGIMIADVPENRVWSQPWYLPRVSNDNRSAFEYYSYVKGVALTASEPLSPSLASEVSVKPRKQVKPYQVSPIDTFNEYFRSPVNYLLIQGYVMKGGKLLRPNSSTGCAGVQVADKCKDGVVRVYSHGNDVLNDGYAHDAFDCYVMLQHNGNMTDAFKALNNMLIFNGIPLYQVNNARYGKYKRLTGLLKRLSMSLVKHTLSAEFGEEYVKGISCDEPVSISMIDDTRKERKQLITLMRELGEGTAKLVLGEVYGMGVIHG